MGWEFVGQPRRYEGGADRGADVDFGYVVHLRSSDGLDGVVNVELVRGGSLPLTIVDANRIVCDYLADEELPRRLVVARDGKVFRSG